MDSGRFDQVARLLAGRSSRRVALGRLAGGGLAAGLVGMGGPQLAAAQGSTPAAGAEAGRCVLAFTVSVTEGPSKGTELRGILRLPLDRSGAIEQGSLIVGLDQPELKELPVVGQANGRAVNLLITVADGQYMYGVGTAEQPIGTCAGMLGGPLVGPKPGDFGEWAGFASCSDCVGAARQLYNLSESGFPSQRVIKACQAAGACLALS